MPTLDFKGKAFVHSHHLTVPFRELVLDAKKSCPPPGGQPSLEDNLIIHGDNLHALKALLPVYAGKVDCIYIDPPYNTGNEGWCYNDAVRSPLMREWLRKSANPVDKEDLERHDKWLCMMWPRLQLLCELLADKGSLWITLDENEVHHTRSILNEILGENCFVSQIVWRSSDNSNNDAKGFSTDKNFVLVFGKRPGWLPAKLASPEKRRHFKNPDNDPRGAWFDGNPVDSPNPRENLKYNLSTPLGKTISHPNNGWRWEKSAMMEKLKSGEIRYNEDETRIIRRTYLDDMKDLPPSDLWVDLEKFGHNRNAKYELQKIFGGDEPFPTPKPSKLILSVLELIPNPNALVLDSFAGSGTTAHAVLALNKKDGGNRKFILVETEDYADKLTAERVRRVIHGYQFTGTQREELLREPLNWTKLQKAAALVEKAGSIEQFEGTRFDRVTKSVEDGALVVTGEKKVTEQAEGLGGSFTFCALGEEMTMEKLLGSGLPTYEALAKYVFFTATGRTLNDAPKQASEKDWFIGETDLYRVHLLYRADKKWLAGNDAALNEALVETLCAGNKAKKRVLVFASAKFMSQRELTRLGVDFCQLPYTIHRILGE